LRKDIYAFIEEFILSIKDTEIGYFQMI